MFIGHYGIALGLKKYTPEISLGFLFIAVQLADIAFFIFLPLGLENARIVPGFTAANSFDLYDFPITHSLAGSLAWAAAVILFVRYIALRSSTATAAHKNRTALLLGVAVLSHYLLDFLVHTPDLLLIPGIDLKIGLSLWNSIPATILVETIILLGGGLIYFYSTTSGTGFVGKYGISAFLFVLVIFIIITPFQTFPDMLTVALVSEILYALFALVAFWLDSRRTLKIQS
ncbi:MAG: hypothetical protein ACFFAX_16485 [Promethearchaeota archaeon]